MKRLKKWLILGGSALITLILTALSMTFISFYVRPVFGGEPDTAFLVIGVALLILDVIVLIVFWGYAATRKIANLGAVTTLIALSYFAYLMLSGTQLPTAAKDALTAYTQVYGESSPGVEYHHQGKNYLIDQYSSSTKEHTPVWVTPHCVIISKPLLSGMNAFIVEKHDDDYLVNANPTRHLWESLGCGHTDSITNPGFQELSSSYAARS